MLLGEVGNRTARTYMRHVPVRHRTSVRCVGPATSVAFATSGSQLPRCDTACVPRPGGEGERSLWQCGTAGLANAVLLVGRPRGQVLAGGADGERERLPEIVKARVV